MQMLHSVRGTKITLRSPDWQNKIRKKWKHTNNAEKTTLETLISIAVEKMKFQSQNMQVSTGTLSASYTALQSLLSRGSVNPGLFGYCAL